MAIKAGKDTHRSHMLAVVALVIALLLVGLAFSAESAYAAQKGTVAVDALNVRSGPGVLNPVVGVLYAGNTVVITGTEKDYTGATWYQIEYQGTTAYVNADYITLNSEHEYVYDEQFEAALDKQGFPESYKPYLRNLHADYPQWVFTACQTGLSWNDVIAKESKVGTSLVAGTSPSSWKSMEKGAYDFTTKKYIQYDTGNWVSASESIIKYYMDPRNFLDAGGIFQFLTHAYDSGTQTEKGLSNVIAGTFLARDFPESSHDSYSQVLMEAGQRSGVNPYVLASMILVEQGSSGNGGCISGKVSGYKGYYNFFNIGAYAANGMDAITRGLWYASQSGSYERPWDSRYKSILGGAEFYGTNYVRNNKYTLYLKKFNVMNGLENVGQGQYMTNIQGAESEANALRRGYLSVLQEPMTFAIPVYTGMPASACLKPMASANNNNFLASLSVSGYTLSPKFSRYTTAYKLTVGKNVSAIEVKAKLSSSSAKISGSGTIKLTADTQKVKLTVTAPSGEKRVYTITVTRSSDGQSVQTPQGDPKLKTSYTLGDYLTGVKAGTSYATMMNSVSVVNGSAVVQSAGGKTVTSGKIGTGMKLAVCDGSGKVVKQYVILVKGDIDGDGKITDADAAEVQNHLTGLSVLKNVYLAASDVNDDGRVNSLDVLFIQRHAAGSYVIS